MVYYAVMQLHAICCMLLTVFHQLQRRLYYKNLHSMEIFLSMLWVSFYWLCHLTILLHCIICTCESSYCFQCILAIAILSICLSHGQISQKRCKLRSPNLHHRLHGRL